METINLKTKLYKYTGIVFLSIVSIILCQAQEKNKFALKVAKELSKTMPDKITEAGIPGAAIAVIDNSKVVWSETFGNIDDINSKQIDLSTTFSIQSMSKSFTALAVLMAVQDKLVNLDAPIIKYIPGFTVNSIYDKSPESLITLRHLLTHRAGFTHDAAFGSNSDNRYDFEKHIKSISTTWLRYPVGYQYAYSNLGIDLAAYILQVQSGISFEQYMKEKVFDPIGMINSSVDMKIIEKNTNRAIGHSDGGIDIPLYIPMIGAGGVYSCITDMVKYAQFHINKGIVNDTRMLRKDLIEEMHTIQYAKLDQRSGYCFCLLREPVSDSYNLYHSGGGYGFFSDMVFYPEKKFSVVLLMNSVNGYKVGQWHLREQIKKVLEEQCGDTPIDKPGYENMIKVNNNDPKLQKILGRYGKEDGISLEQANDTIGLRYLSGNYYYPLSFYKDNGDLVGFYGNFSEIRFLPSYNWKKSSMTTINRRIGAKYFHLYNYIDSPNDPPGPNKKEWQKYIGKYEMYEYEQPEDTSEISIKKGYLYYEDRKCREYAPGFFFTHDNEVLDFNSNPPSIRNLPLRKIE